MSQYLSDEDTIIVATYANRQDAEMAKAQLAEHEIESLIIADDTHPSFQLTEGVKLCVLEGVAEEACRILEAENVSGDHKRVDEGDLTHAPGGWVQATAWTYVAAFVFMVALILTGLLVGL